MLDEILSKVKNASFKLQALSEATRNRILEELAGKLLANMQLIMMTNQKDLENARLKQYPDKFIDRLALDEKRIQSMASSLIQIAKMPAVVGQVLEEIQRPNGLQIQKVSVPFGVLAVIFEARPNVLVDVVGIAIKTANAAVLKGGKEALMTNECLIGLIGSVLERYIPKEAMTLITDTDRSVTLALLTKRAYIDLVIPRGGSALIDFVVENARIPFIETGAGNCHLYVEKTANLEMAVKIAVNAKYQRPSVCNAIEKLLVDQEIAADFLPMLYEKFLHLGIEMRGDVDVQALIPCSLMEDTDYDTEYNDLIITIKIVKGCDDAIEHINKYSTKHSETIVTEDEIAKNKFFRMVDSACVYHNASTRFSDGGEFGFGTEIGISTQKLHARGPMGLKEMLTYQYRIEGKGQVR